ncbi:hypothetical protein LOK49_LG05G00966 [Camellia lanceoleosa]|uniref:Uncharacterized protein n=1 Tax=Camellia lanceoleosa TaxID=1840588 RepID=A0ACC0HLV2_9ERIC|nr:hypothetical protein LOK49_LG05G00966 [Camellia lanceoleosa]
MEEPAAPSPSPPLSLSLHVHLHTNIFVFMYFVIIGSVGEEEALLGVALVEPRRGGIWEGSSCWAVTLQDIGVYHRTPDTAFKSPRHAHMRFSGTWSVSSFPPVEFEDNGRLLLNSVSGWGWFWSELLSVTSCGYASAYAWSAESLPVGTRVRARNIAYCASPVFDFVILGHE